MQILIDLAGRKVASFLLEWELDDHMEAYITAKYQTL
jgi:hypothetical protein